MVGKKKGLGRGLSALFGDQASEERSKEAEERPEGRRGGKDGKGRQDGKG